MCIPKCMQPSMLVCILATFGANESIGQIDQISNNNSGHE